MSKDNHHSLLHSTMNKIATRVYNKSSNSRRDEQKLVRQNMLLDKRQVKNALSRNLFLSVGEKLNLYKSYEDALKHDQSSIIEKNKELMAKLTAIKPPLVPKNSIGFNKNLAMSKTSLMRKTMFISRDKVTKPKVFKKMDNLSPNLSPNLPSLRCSKSRKILNSSSIMNENKLNQSMKSTSVSFYTNGK